MSWRAFAKSPGPPLNLPSAAMHSRPSDCARVPFPGLRAKNVLDLLQRKITFFQAIVEMRREAHTRLRSKVHHYFPAQQFAAHFVSMGTIDRYRTRSFRGIFRCVHVRSEEHT